MSINEKIKNNWYLEQEDIQTLIKRYKIMKYINYVLAIAITALLLSCTNSPTLTNPKPCAEYELKSVYGNTAVFERDITMRVNVADYEGDLVEGDTYTLCSSASETYISQ